MSTTTMFRRSSGVVLHISSLPSPYGIGSMGEDAYRFVDFLRDGGQTYWQVLPLGQTGFGDSPYQCFSAAAGNPYFIDLDELHEMGLLTEEDLEDADCGQNPDRVNFEKIASTRFDILRRAFRRADNRLLGKVWAFRYDNRDWVEDYAMFLSLKNHFDQKALWDWDDEKIKAREPEAMRRYAFELKDSIDFYVFLQYLFFEQWNRLRAYANEQGIQIIGDIPIYVSPDSCDVWAHPQMFRVDKDLKPCGIAGVPPDYYSATGQLWGNPVYDWDYIEKDGYKWWLWRIRRNLALFDVTRLDHFRGFQAYWEVPAGEDTAINGKWLPGPRMNLFDAIKQEFGEVPFIAEDLGDIDDDVREFLAESGYPGMHVMIFGLRANEDNDHLPHNWLKNSVGYTSTHDSETICEQIMDHCTEEDKKFSYSYLRTSHNEPMGWSAIRTAFLSPAVIAMTTMQDVLSLGADARMNTPATIGGNWSWRVRREAINGDVAAFLRDAAFGSKRLNPDAVLGGKKKGN